MLMGTKDNFNLHTFKKKKRDLNATCCDTNYCKMLPSDKQTSLKIDCLIG